MKTWQQLLREHDPGDVSMDPEVARHMREVIVRTGPISAVTTSGWPVRLALAAFACLVLMMSIFGTGRSIATQEAVAPMTGAERRQIQFATPGGTRIIWELNPDFTLTETLP